MGRVKKQLHLSNVNRNSSISINHSIRKIKEHELRYTIILVMCFLSIFIFIGYHFFSISSDFSLNDETINYRVNSYSFGSVFLDSHHIMDDAVGLRSESYPLLISNDRNDIISYRILLMPDTSAMVSCGCNQKNFDVTKIHYSLNKRDVLTLKNSSEMVLDEGILYPNESKNVSITMWIDSSVVLDEDYHFHGYFVLNRS